MDTLTTGPIGTAVAGLAWIGGFALAVAVVELIGRAIAAYRDRRGKCWCGHLADAHEHYRPGNDCGACGSARCPAYSPR